MIREHHVPTAIGTGTRFLRERYARNRFLCWVAVCNLLLALTFAVLIQVDGRMVLGRNVWVKPWKFATSIAVFTATLAWLLPSLSVPDRLERTATATIGTAMLVEIVLISTQAARAVPSHFNDSTPLDTAIFGVMGVAITISTIAVVAVLWWSLRNPPALHPAYRAGIWLGLGLFVAASLEGFLMVGIGGHSVGGTATGPELPFIGWRLSGGDLRIAHAIGLHALQVLPLTGYLAARRYGRSTRLALGIVGSAGIAYTGIVGATLALALLGRSPIPTVTTLPWAAVFGASFLLVAPFWAAMILAPTWTVTDRLTSTPYIALPAAGLYLILLLPQVDTVAAGVLTPSLPEVASLLATDAGVTLAWVHFLAFDLFVGRWIYRDARRRGITSLLVSPVLVLTLLFGPVGVLTYGSIRAVRAAGTTLMTGHRDEATA